MGWEIFYDPFGRMRKGSTLGLGVAVIALLAVASVITGAVLDGALDLHIGPVQPTLLLAAVLSVIDWLCLAFCFLLVAIAFGAPGRDIVTYLGTVAVARWPMVIGLVVSSRSLMGGVIEEGVKLNPGGTMTVDPTKFMNPVFLLAIPVVLIACVWTVTLCVFALKRSSGLSGGRLAGAAVIGLIVAEIISKLLVAAAVIALG